MKNGASLRYALRIMPRFFNVLTYIQLNGKMSIPSRELAMERFKEDPEIKILISSLLVGGTGLDLTMANKCILLDLWWNQAVEQQVNIPSNIRFSYRDNNGENK